MAVNMDCLDAGILLVPSEDAEASGIDPKKHAYFDNPEKGLVGHPVLIEATHQLHCLVSCFTQLLELTSANSRPRIC